MIEDDFLSNFTGAAEQMGNGRKIMVVAVGEEPPSIKASRTQSNPDSRGLHQPILKLLFAKKKPVNIKPPPNHTKRRRLPKNTRVSKAFYIAMAPKAQLSLAKT